MSKIPPYLRFEKTAGEERPRSATTILSNERRPLLRLAAAGFAPQRRHHGLCAFRSLVVAHVPAWK